MCNQWCRLRVGGTYTGLNTSLLVEIASMNKLVDQLEFKASRDDSSKECRKDFDQVSPTPFLKWEDTS